MTTNYVCFLWGKNVFTHCSIICTIKSIDDLDLVRQYIKDRFNIEFDNKDDQRFSSNDYHIYRNKTDNRDVSLIIQSVLNL